MPIYIQTKWALIYLVYAFDYWMAGRVMMAENLLTAPNFWVASSKDNLFQLSTWFTTSRLMAPIFFFNAFHQTGPAQCTFLFMYAMKRYWNEIHYRTIHWNVLRCAFFYLSNNRNSVYTKEKSKRILIESWSKNLWVLIFKLKERKQTCRPSIFHLVWLEKPNGYHSRALLGGIAQNISLKQTNFHRNSDLVYDRNMENLSNQTI